MDRRRHWPATRCNLCHSPLSYGHSGVGEAFRAVPNGGKGLSLRTPSQAITGQPRQGVVQLGKVALWGWRQQQRGKQF